MRKGVNEDTRTEWRQTDLVRGELKVGVFVRTSWESSGYPPDAHFSLEWHSDAKAFQTSVNGEPVEPMCRLDVMANGEAQVELLLDALRFAADALEAEFLRLRKS